MGHTIMGCTTSDAARAASGDRAGGKLHVSFCLHEGSQKRTTMENDANAEYQGLRKRPDAHDVTSRASSYMCCDLRRMNTLQREKIIFVQANAINALRKGLLLTLRKFDHVWGDYEQNPESIDSEALNLIESMRDLKYTREEASGSVRSS